MRFVVPVSVVLSTLAAAAATHAGYEPGAVLFEPALTGNTQYDGWINLNSVSYPGYGGFPGNGSWPSGIGSNRTLSNTFNISEPGDALLLKTGNGTGGGPYLAGGSIYFGGFSADINNPGGSLAVSDTTPVADLRNVVFQVQIGEAWTFDFVNHALPTLSFNGGSQNLAATTTVTVERFFNGTVQMPTGEENVYINTYLLQWDLSAIAGPITDFRANFTGVQHAQVYGLRLDQSDVYTTVPAPGAAALLAVGMGAMSRRRRR